MRKCRKIGAKAVLGTVGMVVFLAAAICGYEWHCCMVEKDKLLADNNRQKMQLDAYEKKLDEYIQSMKEWKKKGWNGWRMVLAGRAACI